MSDNGGRFADRDSLEEGVEDLSIIAVDGR